MYTVVRSENQRLEQLRALMHDHAYEAFLVTSPTNRAYMSGFTGTNGALLITHHAALVFTDFRYRIQVTYEAPSFTLYEVSQEHTLAQALTPLIGDMNLSQIAFEATNMSVSYHQKLIDAFDGKEGRPSIKLVPSEGIIETLREVKDDDELATLRRAIAITDAAFQAVVAELQPHHTERQVAWMLEAAIRERGADGVAFPIIVASGANAAMPHSRPGDTPLGTGKPIVIDMGARYNGYHADMTRTIVLGEPDAHFWTIYTTVQQAQEQAIATIRPGMSGEEADSIARTFIESAGYGDLFGHGTGHGVGLDIHESPRLGRKSTHTMRVGNVFSIEPGIYQDDWGGVRIEDLVVLHEHGCEVLSQTPKHPVVPVALS